jgi:hypothetical protein
MAELQTELSVLLADNILLTSDLDATIKGEQTLTSDLDITVKGEQTLTSGLDLAINVKYLCSDLDVLLYEGDAWGYARQGADRSRNPSVRLQPGSPFQCAILGDPVTRHYYIDDDGAPIEAGLGGTPSNKNPASITMVNVWSRKDECVKVLICDQRLSHLLAYQNARFAIDGRVVVIENVGRGERYYGDDYSIEFLERDVPQEAYSEVFDLRTIDLNRVVLL